MSAGHGEATSAIDGGRNREGGTTASLPATSDIGPLRQHLVPEDRPEPLVSSEWTFADQCAALKASKDYEGQAGA